MAFVCVPDAARAAEFWVDPVRGKPGNDGSASAPWRSLQEVLDSGLVATRGWSSLPYEPGAELVDKNAGAPVQGGDTIYLRSGDYGALRVLGLYNAKPITVAAQKGHAPRFERILVRASSNWRFRGMHVSQEHAPEYERTTLFDIDSHGWHGPVRDIVVENSRLQSVADSSVWSARDWDETSCGGIEADGQNVVIRNNVIRNVYHGIRVGADGSLVEGNLIDGFAGDGMQGTGNDSVFQHNTVKNCHHVNDEHHDGFQSWSRTSKGVGTGAIRNVVVRGNTFISYEDPNQPHRAPMHGIGCFDGLYVGWVVENNVIITDDWHGIAFAGLRSSRIVNNTVINPNRAQRGRPWIMVSPDRKRGTPSEDVVVRNNLTAALIVEKGQAVKNDHNLVIQSHGKLFVDPVGYDLRLRKKGRAVDAGSADLAPEVDHDGAPRPWGAGFDIGAYEYHEGAVRREAPERGALESPDEPEVEQEPAPSVPEEPAAADTVVQVAPEPQENDTSHAMLWAAVVVAVSLLGAFWLIRR